MTDKPTGDKPTLPDHIYGSCDDSPGFIPTYATRRDHMDLAENGEDTGAFAFVIGGAYVPGDLRAIADHMTGQRTVAVPVDVLRNLQRYAEVARAGNAEARPAQVVGEDVVEVVARLRYERCEAECREDIDPEWSLGPWGSPKNEEGELTQAAVREDARRIIADVLAALRGRGMLRDQPRSLGLPFVPGSDELAPPTHQEPRHAD